MSEQFKIINEHKHHHGEHECCHGGHHSHEHGHCSEHEHRHGKEHTDDANQDIEETQYVDYHEEVEDMVGHKHYEKMVEKQMHLETDDGQELVCDVLEIFPLNIKGVDKQYIALLPQGYEDVLLYDYSENGDEPILALIEDDDEFALVSEEFMKLVEQENE